MNFDDFKKDENQFQKQFDQKFQEFNQKTVGNKKRNQTHRDGPTNTAINQKRGVINTARAQSKFDEEYFNLFEPRQMDVQDVASAQSPNDAKEESKKNDKIISEEMSFELRNSAFGEKGRSQSNHMLKSQERRRKGHKTDIEGVDRGLTDSIFDNMENQNVRSQYVREQSDVDGKSSSNNYSQNAVLDGKNILKFNPVKASIKVKGFRNVQQALAKKPKQNLDNVVFDKIQFGFEEFGQNQSVDTFRKELEITQNLEIMLEKMSQMKMENQEQTRDFLTYKGLYLFESLKDKLNSSNKNYENNVGDMTVGDPPNEIKVKGVEKFVINEEHDFKEWERYDIMCFKNHSSTSAIPVTHYPTYIREDILQSQANHVKELKSGYKSGKKLSDPDVKWVEKWFELQARDSGIDKSQQNQIIVKGQSKFWTNTEDNTIDGSSCLQVLNKHHGLLMEMKNDYKVSNFLNKEGSLRKRTIKVRKPPPRKFDIIADQSVSKNGGSSQFQHSGFRMHESENENPLVFDNEEIPETVVVTTNVDFRKSVVMNSNPEIFRNLSHSRSSIIQQNSQRIASPHEKAKTSATPTSSGENIAVARHSMAGGSSIHNVAGTPSDIAQRYQQQQDITYQEFKQDMPMQGFKKDIWPDYRQQLNQAKANQNIEDQLKKFDEVFEDIVVEDPYANSQEPIADREFKTIKMVGYLTQFDGHANKQREEGVEQKWTQEGSTVIQLSQWKSNFDHKESIKDIKYVETDQRKKAMENKDLKTGFREGTNKYGQFWKEDWQINQKTGYTRWNKSNQRFQDDGFEIMEGEWREEQAGQVTKGEKWVEKKKEYDDYWERSSTRYTEYPKTGVRINDISDLDKAFEKVLVTRDEQVRIIRSGITDFRNNRNYLNAEHWEEYIDGTLLKKIINDNGYGKKIMEEQGRKLNLDKMDDIQLVTDENGYFLKFKDAEGNEFKSLQELIAKNKQFLEWEHNTMTIDDLTSHKIIQKKIGKDYIDNTEWDNEKLIDHAEESGKKETVKNKGQDAEGSWKERWERKGLEKWCKKEGQKSGMEWNEQWYQRMKGYSKKKDENGNELSGYESDGSQVEESNCEKYGRNEQTQEEWHEKWGEKHQPGQKLKWCDKWQIDLASGLKKGENWGQTYTDDYQIKEHWAEKWDDRHADNGGVYERRHEFGVIV